MTQVLAEDTPERRELVRAIDMVRKRVQRTKRYQPLDAFTTPASDLDQRQRDRLELGEILEAARRAVLTARQDRIIELWMRGWSVPEIGAELKLPVTRVSDEKYKALRKLERQLGNRRDELRVRAAGLRFAPRLSCPDSAGPSFQARQQRHRLASIAARTAPLCPSTFTFGNIFRTIPAGRSRRSFVPRPYISSRTCFSLSRHHMLRRFCFQGRPATGTEV